MKTPTKFKSIFNIRDHIPKERHPQYASYDNKKLSNYKHDDFADLVFDQCDLDMNLCCDKDSFLNEIEMLEYIPKYYSRVYLYGVWECIKNIPKNNNNK